MTGGSLRTVSVVSTSLFVSNVSEISGVISFLILLSLPSRIKEDDNPSSKE